MVIKPNLFIVGAPKSGTTALYSYLKSHSRISMSKIKEPQFFARDVCDDQRNTLTMSEYLSCFDSEGKNCLVVGEASTCYLGSKEAPLEIREFCPESQIVVILRNPIDVMYAEHSERVFGGTEHITDFEIALDSPEPRRWRRGPFKNELVKNLSYRELTVFSEQVLRYFTVFGRKNVHVIIYDDFARNPEGVYQSVISFLRLDTNCGGDFSVINANRRARSNFVHDLSRYPPPLAKKLARGLLPQSMRRTIGNYIRRFNVKEGKRSPLSLEFRKRLTSEYAAEVRQLGRILDRDLAAMWNDPWT